MTANAGVVRNGDDLRQALLELDSMAAAELPLALKNWLLSARFIVAGALLRKETRGSHYRSDYPDAGTPPARHSYLDMDDIARISGEVRSASSNVVRVAFGQ